MMATNAYVRLSENFLWQYIGIPLFGCRSSRKMQIYLHQTKADGGPWGENVGWKQNKNAKTALCFCNVHVISFSSRCEMGGDGVYYILKRALENDSVPPGWNVARVWVVCRWRSLLQVHSARADKLLICHFWTICSIQTQVERPSSTKEETFYWVTQAIFLA